MLKGLAITPPVLGRISIGKVIERNGKRLPEKDDQFTITSQVQSKDGWPWPPAHAIAQVATLPSRATRPFFRFTVSFRRGFKRRSTLSITPPHP